MGRLGPVGGQLSGIKALGGLGRLAHSLAAVAHAAAHHAKGVAAPALGHAVHIELVGGVQGQVRGGQGDGLAGLLGGGGPNRVSTFIL